MGNDAQIKFEEPGVGESACNGVVEREILEVESQARTLVHAAEQMHDTNLEPAHGLKLWAVEYAGQILSRSQRSMRDDKIAFEFRVGLPYRRALPEFGEPVHFLKVAPTGRRKKLGDRWETGTYVGIVDKSC